MTEALGRVGTAAAAAACTVIARRALLAAPPGGRQRWERLNYRRRQVDLLGGPAAAGGAVVGALASGQPGAVLAVVGGAALGLYDDLAGSTHARGLRGHAAALRAGTVTTGTVKLAGLSATAVGAALTRRRSVTDVVVDSVLVAGGANLVNLFDLRPGRAWKVTVLGAVPLAVFGRRNGRLPASLVGAAAVSLPADLAERQMLGDCGANAVGAALGWSAATRLGPVGRVLAALGVVGLTLLSERTSFSAVIESNPLLAALDLWGRRRG